MATARSGRSARQTGRDWTRAREQKREHIPPGWDYDPSAWSQRIPIAVIASIGFLIASYLTLFQLGIVSTVWEPFFGDGSRVILTSRISRALPVPDAMLGALGYLTDAVAGIIGGRGRWRSMPWIVVIFGIAVGPLGIVSVMLVVFQPVLLSEWCTLCLASAAISLIMIGPAMDEFLASMQHLKREHAKGHSLWRAFWGLEG